MGSGKKRKNTRTRPAILTSRSVTPVDLLLLAGLPHPLHTRIEEFIKELAGPYCKVIAVSSGSYDGNLYRRRPIESLLRAAADFSIRRLKNRGEGHLPQPRRIALFYVPADDEQQLLDAFDFFVFPIPLRDLAPFDNSGHQMRHDRDACEKAVRKGFEVYSRELIGALQPRIEGRKSSEPLLLPPLNFHLSGRRLRQVFCELTRRTRTWENAMPDNIAPEMFDEEQLPGFLRHQERQMIFRDVRNVVFPCARASEFHGQPPEVDQDSDISVLQDFLRSVYRFGTPLPDGFHHDAQLEGGVSFQQMSFDCSRNGSISVSSDHANLYPNDYVGYES
jgi:hypothetical protein